MADLTYAYPRPSALSGDALRLAAFAEDAPAATCFFQGRLRDSWLTARGLSTLAQVVAARFVPRGAVLRDPIVTAGGGQLRFEAFSSCNGVYARLDLGPAALDGALRSGTTNVDFNETMVNALVRIGRAEPVGLSVGEHEVGLHRAEGSVRERRVALPERWLKGLTAAQGYLAQMDERLYLTRAQAAQLLAALPPGAARTDYFLVLRGARPAFAPVAPAAGPAGSGGPAPARRGHAGARRPAARGRARRAPVAAERRRNRRSPRNHRASCRPAGRPGAQAAGAVHRAARGRRRNE